MSDVTQVIIDKLNDVERRLANLERREAAHTSIGARVYNKAAFSHNSSGNWLPITFDSERFDTPDFHEAVTNPSYFTIATPGTYAITGHANFASSATGYRQLGIRLGGATFIAVHSALSVGANSSTNLSIAAIYQFAAAQYVELCAWQDSGGTLAIDAQDAYTPEFAIVRVA